MSAGDFLLWRAQSKMTEVEGLRFVQKSRFDPQAFTRVKAQCPSTNVKLAFCTEEALLSISSVGQWANTE